MRYCIVATLLSVAAAQDFVAANEPAAPRFDLQPSLQALAHWYGPKPESSERQQAVVMLAVLAGGSNLRIGTYRATVRTLTTAVRAKDPWPLPLTLQDHLLTSLAMTRAAELSDYRPLVPACRACVERIGAHVADPTTAPMRPEEHLLLRLLLEECAAAKLLGDETGRALAAASKSARIEFRLGKSRRDDAAQLLASKLAGTAVPDDQLLATVWPANLAADPLHTWIAVLAATRVAQPLRAATLEGLDNLVAARVPAGQADAGTWPPAAGFDRITTTALFTLALATANQALATPK